MTVSSTSKTHGMTCPACLGRGRPAANLDRMRVDEIAATVAFLVSDEASYITAETINVVGGSYVAP